MTEQRYPSRQVKLQPTYQYEFDQIRMDFGEMIEKVAPLIKAGIPSLEEFKRYLQRCFRDLKPQLTATTCRSFDDVMELVEEKCTLINVCCLERIVKRYNIKDAMQHITEFNTAVDSFCKNVKLSVCRKESFMRSLSSHDLTCETIEFVLDWEADKYTLRDVKELLSKAFEDVVNSVQVRVINDGNSIIVTCYAPQNLMDILLLIATKNLDLLKGMGLMKLSIGYHTIYDKRKRDEVSIR